MNHRHKRIVVCSLVMSLLLCHPAWANKNADSAVLTAEWIRNINSTKSIEDYSYQNDKKQLRNVRTLRDCDYFVLEDVDIPGMPSTHTRWIGSDIITDSNQCPQGFCMTEEHYLISAYNNNQSRLGALYLIDRNTKQYTGVVRLKNGSHLGGIAYDGRNIWVCHSDNHTLEKISYQEIKKQDSQLTSEEKKHNLTGTEVYSIQNRPSCITYHDGMLWVATTTRYFTSEIVCYRYNKDVLNKIRSYRLPAKVQGVAFDDAGRIYLSTSYGRQNSSYLMIYESVDKMHENLKNYQHMIEMPPCSEEIEIMNGTVHVLFESASEKYREGTDGKGSSISPIEKIISIPIRRNLLDK